MRIACLLLLLSQLLAADDYKLIATYSGVIYGESSIKQGTSVSTYLSYSYHITKDIQTGTKYFDLDAAHCQTVQPPLDVEPTLHGPVKLVWPDPTTTCDKLPYADAITLTEIQAGLSFFYSLAPGKVAHIIEYGYNLIGVPGGGSNDRAPHGDLTTLAPNAPVDPQMIYLDE